MNLESKKRIDIAKNFFKLLKEEMGEELISFAIFGSTGRGRAKKESDIDILLIVKDKKRATRKYIETKLKTESFLFSSVIVTEEGLKKNPYILLDIIEDGIIIYDRDRTLKKLIKTLKKILRKLGARRIWISKDKWYWDLKPTWKPGEIIDIRL